jgi:SSS family solute:Na+ symporter
MALGWLDLAVLAAYFVVTLTIGFWFGRRERSTEDFFLGGRRQHWLLAGISIIATEISALTVIAVPGDAFKTDWSYLQMYAGSFIGRVLIVYMLLPAFYGGAVTTVYEYLGQRFGPWTRTIASLMFFASRILGSGIRLLVASLAISEIFGWRLEWVVIAATGVAMLYATYGGIKAILWTDAFQALVFVSAAATLIVVLFLYTPGHYSQNFGDAYYAGKFHTFTGGISLKSDKGFWLLTINAVFVTMAAMGTDQDLTQRMLTCTNLKQSQRSLIFNAIAGFPIVCTFLFVGSMLWAYYESRPFETIPDHIMDRHELILPYFIAHGLPRNVGLQGIMVAAIFAAAMGSLSSAIGALASTAVTDIYRPLVKASRSEAHFLGVARGLTVFFGVVLILVALAFQHCNESLLWAVFKWVGLVFGGMLGVFVLGVTTKGRGRDGVNALAMVTSVALLIALMIYQDAEGTVYIAWPWWIVLGTVWTYALGALFQTRRASIDNLKSTIDN